MEDDRKSKYDFLLYLLEKGDAMVCLDARGSTVDVPKNHKSNSSLSLIFNLNFKRPIEITRDGIFATLAFQGRPYSCVIPFEAVWAIFEPSYKEGQVWEEEMPEDIDLKIQTVTGTGKKTSLKAVPDEISKDGKPMKVISKRDRKHLRVIK